MIRTLVATGVFAVAGFAGVAAAPAASADQLCQVVTADTVATNPVGVTECPNTPFVPECVWVAPSLLPYYSAYVQVCAPAL